MVGKIYSCSSLFMKGIEVVSVIDSGFRGVIYVVLHNHSDREYNVSVTDRIAQIISEKISLHVLTSIKF